MRHTRTTPWLGPEWLGKTSDRRLFLFTVAYRTWIRYDIDPHNAFWLRSVQLEWEHRGMYWTGD